MLGRKQHKFMVDPLPRMTILHGSISSGKTFVGNHKSIEHIINNYENKGLVIFVGRTLTTLERNVLEPLSLAYKGMFKYSLSQKKAMLFNTRIELEGCNDMTAETKIRGSTAEFIYGDEITLWNKPFLMRCMGSLRTANACFLGTTNPDSPQNFVKKDYLDRKEELGLREIYFNMDDNPQLTEEYKRQVSLEYTGVFHDRFIKGLWVIAEGLIYPHYQQAIEESVERNYTEYQISMDYGIMNPTSMGLWGKCGATWYRIKEYYHSGRDSNQQKTDDEYYTELVNLAENLPIRKVIIDPSALSFITLIRRKGKFPVFKADNSVIDGIRNTSTAIQRGIIKINDCCKESIKEFQVYAWDTNSTEDRPIKDNDHCLTGDTIVNTIDGDIAIKDLIGKTGDVYCFDEKNNFVTTSKYFDVRLTQKQAKIYKVELDNGKVFRATEEHPVLTENGWKKIKELNEADKILDISLFV